MPPSRLKKQKIKKRRTIKKSKGRRIWIYQKGNVRYCFSVPFLRIIPSRLHGGTSNEGELLNKLFTKLPATKSGKEVNELLQSYKIYGDENVLLKGLTTSIDKKIIEELSDSSKELETKEGKLTQAGAALLAWVKSRQPARDFMIPILEKIKGDKKYYTPEELMNIEELLNHKKPQSEGVLSSMTTNAFSKISKGASSLGSFFTPLDIVGEDGKVPKKRNDTYIQLLWFPRSSIHYRKGKSKDSSKVVDKNDPKYGEFMVYIEPEKYADTMTYITSRINSVEDFFANIMDGCKDGLCQNGTTKPEPFKHQVIQINNYQPEFDAQERSDNLTDRQLSV